MQSETYTPELETQLIQYYHEYKYFDKLKPFINYIDEVKDLLLDDGLNHCKYKQDRYNSKIELSPIRFFEAVLRNNTISMTEALINYLDATRHNHQYQVRVNGNYWKSFLTKAKREYDLKNLLTI